MIGRLELSIAWRYLRSRRGSRLLSFISIIAIGGVIVGVSALILVMGVITGLQRDLREKILVGSPDIRILPYGEGLRMTDWQNVLKRAKDVDGVVAAAPFVLTQGVISAGRDYNSGTYIAGIEPTVRADADVTTIRQHATSGDFRFASSDGQQRGVVLGRLLADRLQAYVGDTVVLLTMPSSGMQVSAATGLPTPRSDRLEVTGIFDSGLYEYDNAYVYVSLKSAQELAGLGGDVTGIEVKTRDRWDAARVASRLDETFGFQFRSVDWQEQNSTLFQALKLEKLGMAVILLLIIIVAAFNIVSNLTMLVADKTKEIGILKAMGMRARSIRRVFLTQGLVIGVVGTLVGLLLGIAASLALGKYKFIRLNPEIYFIDHLPVQLEFGD
ncbi:MAG TPA: ABC transporter permease, partial [Gemmatimonadaceae bacterium]|nr:ABC transporter permease [Gemmatimonadaceae bacterium]